MMSTKKVLLEERDDAIVQQVRCGDRALVGVQLCEADLRIDFVRALKAAAAWGRWRALSNPHQREHVEAIEGRRSRRRAFDGSIALLQMIAATENATLTDLSVRVRVDP